MLLKNHGDAVTALQNLCLQSYDYSYDPFETIVCKPAMTAVSTIQKVFLYSPHFLMGLHYKNYS